MRSISGRRILVAGASGSGKTTLAARIGVVLGVPHTEIDALHWRAGWTANPRFEDDVARLVAADAWITELQYPRVLPVLAARAQLVIWLDLPRPLVLARVVRRTIRRRFQRELLWGVNLEPPLWTVITDPDHIIRWSVRSHRVMEGRVREVLRLRPDVQVLRVRSQRDARRLLHLLAR